MMQFSFKLSISPEVLTGLVLGVAALLVWA
jgi:hypothetical protein